MPIQSDLFSPEKQMNMNSNDILTIESNWKRLEKMADEGIDYSNILPLRKGVFERAAVYVPASKRTANVQLDEDILVWFKAQSAVAKNERICYSAVG